MVELFLVFRMAPSVASFISKPILVHLEPGFGLEVSPTNWESGELPVRVVCKRKGKTEVKPYRLPMTFAHPSRFCSAKLKRSNLWLVLGTTDTDGGDSLSFCVVVDRKLASARLAFADLSGIQDWRSRLSHGMVFQENIARRIFADRPADAPGYNDLWSRTGLFDIHTEKFRFGPWARVRSWDRIHEPQ